MKNYQAVTAKWKAENKGTQPKNVWLNGDAFAKCMEMGLFQAKTSDFKPTKKKAK